MNQEDDIKFHHMTVKLFYLATIFITYLQLFISFLCNRVKEIKIYYWKKPIWVTRYIISTMGLPAYLILTTQNAAVVR